MSRTAMTYSLVLLIFLVIAGCGRPPQLGEDRAAFKAVDALYTAVSLRDTEKVGQCATQLKSLHDAGKLSDAANQVLDSIIHSAQNKEWEPALERLSKFMEGQTR